MVNASYVHSHTRPGKGASYDEAYRTDPWHQYLWSREQQHLRYIIREYFPNDAPDYLDFACGTGRITAVLEPLVKTSTGIDVSEAMLEMARQKLQRTELVRDNLLENDVFTGRRFNLITAFRFFVNAEPELRRGVMAVLERHLAADGIFVFNNHQNADAFYSKVTNAYGRMKRRKLRNTLSIKQCAELLDAVGCRIVEVLPVGLIRFPRIQLPSGFYATADRLAMASHQLSRISESPIIVAKRKAVP